MGKIREWKPRKERAVIPVGSIFGRLTVTGPARETTSENSYRYYECTCECGNVIFPRKDTLINGDSKSCGCLAAEKASERATTHGLSTHPLYDVHSGMLKRCYNSKRKDYKHYGGRGIEVQDGWQDLTKFIEDMGPTFQKGLEIDRIDVNGHYCKENCRWVNRREQVINRRPTGGNFDTHFLTFNGMTMCMSEWAEKIGIPSTMISDRISTLGWSTEKALTTPPKIRDSVLVIGEERYSPRDIFVSYPNVYSVATKLGIKGHEYLSILFKGVGELEVYLCKEWIKFKLPEHLNSFDIYERKVPEFKEEFPHKTLGRTSDE